MAAAATEHDPAYRCPAYQARLCFTSVNAVLQLEESFFSAGIHIIGNRGATERNRLQQNFLNSGVQLAQPLARNRRRSPSGTDAGAKQRLIGINVAYATQKFLIQQRALDGSLASAKKFDELVRAHFQRFHASGIEASGVDAEFSKHARVDKAQFASRGELGDQVSMLGDFGIGIASDETAGHAEMDDPLCGSRLGPATAFTLAFDFLGR